MLVEEQLSATPIPEQDAVLQSAAAGKSLGCVHRMELPQPAPQQGSPQDGSAGSEQLSMGKEFPLLAVFPAWSRL